MCSVERTYCVNLFVSACKFTDYFFIIQFIYCNFAVNIQIIAVCGMSLALIILLGWGVFVCLVFLLLWGDTIYYKYNLPRVCKRVLDAFTEEE